MLLDGPIPTGGKGIYRLFISLRSRLFLLVILLVLPTVILILYSAAEQRRLVAEEIKQNALRLVRLVALEQKQLVDITHETLLLLAQIPEVQSGDRTRCNALFAKLLQMHPLHVNFGVLRPSGELQCSGVPVSHRIHASDRLYFRRALASRAFSVGELQIGHATGKPSINFAYPILDHKGEVRNVLFAALGLTFIHQRAAQAQLPPGSTLTLLDENGTVFVRYPSDKLVGNQMRDAPIVEKILTRRAEGTAEEIGLDGVPHLSAFVPLAYAPQNQTFGYVLISIPKAIAYAPINKLLVRNLVALTLVILVAIAAVFIFGEFFILRPTNTLLAATRRLAAGDLSTRAGLPRESGELGQLAAAFDDMAASLEHRIQERTRTEEEVRLLNVKLERKVQERTSQLEIANRELEAFSHSISHDLRAPLRSIYGFSQVLVEDYAGRLDTQAKDYIERVHNATARMATLIDDLLELSRITRAQIHSRKIDLSKLGQEIVTELQKQQGDRIVEVVIQPGLTAEGDPQLLRVVLRNLLNNAWKFTAKQAQAKVEFGVSDTDQGTVYFVRDNGAGFNMAHAHKLFGVFQRLHAVSEFPGTGVGLASVQRIVQRHGGRVWGEGAVGKGATFYFIL